MDLWNSQAPSQFHSLAQAILAIQDLMHSLELRYISGGVLTPSNQIIMNTIKFTALILLQFTSCGHRSNVPIIDFDRNVNILGISKNLTNQPRKVDFCKIINVEWDLVWIIPPYTSTDQIKKIKAENFFAIRNEIEMAKVAEHNVQLIIIKENKVVAHGILSRRPLDLAGIVKSDGTLISFSKENCDHFIVLPNDLDSLSLKLRLDQLK
ncbi:hypothetical protein OQX61_13830 [Pedobacter sp. PLR]|uniref:hypothetical protein n=1 Tax=Pedobacter sp. PLR TaxID=2994465 RepID=UPI002246611A|nr:hypothetical protein [Pedobacter sp. PLR]MCX2452349.1 hypothetical protein [Pedobacter sp. PLR]